MKIIKLTAVSILLCQMAVAQTLLFSEGFETDGEGTRYTSNTYTSCTTEQDVFFRTNSNPVTPPGCAQIFSTTLTNLQGSFFWASEDVKVSSPTPNSRPAGEILFNSVNITNYTGLTVSIYLATSANNNVRWESTDVISVQASVNSGSYVTVGRFIGGGTTIVGGRLKLDSNLNGVGDASEPDVDQPTFTKYAFSIPSTGTSLRLKIVVDQIGGTEELALDQIELTGNLTLPVDLVGFRATPVGSMVQLAWETASESQVSHFDVERSVDGVRFATIGQAKALGKPSIYHFADAQPPRQTVYYRLKTVDNDGKWTHSRVVSTAVDGAKPVVKIFPTVTEGSVFIEMDAVSSLRAVQIVNALGAVVKTFPASNRFDIGDLPSGLYFVRCTVGQDIVTERVYKR